MNRVPLDAPTGQLPTVEELPDEIQQVTADSLRPVSAGLAILFGLFIVFNYFDLPAHARPYVLMHDVFMVCISLVVWWQSRRGRLSPKLAYPVGSGLALLAATNVFLAQWLLSEPFYTLYIALIMVGAGAFVLSTRWMLSTNLVLLGAWGLISMRFTTPTDFAHLAFILLAASMVGITIQLARLSTQRRMSQLRFRDGARKMELQAALIREAQLRQRADSTVSKREQELVKMHAELSHELEERKRVEQQRQELQAHLVHSQKVESLGRLAGGVAHDFNNLLTVIGGSMQVALLHPDTPQMIRETLEEGAGAAERASRITKQLLAFGRRQVLTPKVISLAQIVDDVCPLLSRLPGKNISLVLDVDPEAGNLYADPSYIEQVIMNLVVNGRDAMAQGGVLRIGVCRLAINPGNASQYAGCAEGDYLCLAVSDTGCGMDQETITRVFDPFYTTKDADKGTGLGLAMVEGIVGQHGGHISVESEPGAGSTFRVLLPRVEREQTSPADTIASARQEMRGTETVLVAEDDEGVRKHSTNVLRSLGYKVLEAADGAEALELAAGTPGDIDLLVSDVIMPRMDGRRLVDSLKKVRPNMKVLFMSGYNDEVFNAEQQTAWDEPFLPKPFTVEGFSLKVREVLDTQQRQHRTGRPSWIAGASASS